jgi:hypothetical protein
LLRGALEQATKELALPVWLPLVRPVWLRLASSRLLAFSLRLASLRLLAFSLRPFLLLALRPAS